MADSGYYKCGALAEIKHEVLSLLLWQLRHVSSMLVVEPSVTRSRATAPWHRMRQLRWYLTQMLQSWSSPFGGLWESPRRSQEEECLLSLLPPRPDPTYVEENR